MEQLQLSDKSQKFIEDLKLYLFSSGKNEKEINDITKELEEHLYEAELDGKSIDQIIGSSPKDYMLSISNEMKTDYKAWVKYLPLIIIGTMSFSVFDDLLHGTLSYSVLKIIGTVVYCLLFLAGVMIAFRYTARNQVSKLREFLILLVPIIMSMIAYGGLYFADSVYSTPIISFGILGSIITGLLFLSFIIGFSIWAKTAILPVVLISIHLPEFALSFIALNEELRLILGLVITYLLIGAYLFYEVKKVNNDGRKSPVK